MPESFERLVQKYHVFYEVSPFHTLIEERHGSATATRRIIQAGFDVDVHGLSTESEVKLPPSAEYASGYAKLKTLADAVADHAGECFIEVITFPSTAFFEAGEHCQPQAVIRIRIAHQGADQAVGLPEENALEELEKQLQYLGIRRR